MVERAEQLVNISVAGSVANDHLIHEAYSLIFSVGTHVKRYRILGQSARRTGTTFCYLPAILCQVPVTQNIRRCVYAALNLKE